MKNTYFDNASTSFPKPPEVAGEICNYLTNCGGTYGRAAYERVQKATALVEKCRDKLAVLMGIKDAEKINFTSNATTGINAILTGLTLQKGTRVWVSALEHNAVMRPLWHLQQTVGVCIDILPSLEDGCIDLQALKKIPTEEVSFLVINHLSNVNGLIQPMDEIAKLAASRGWKIILDCSQSLGEVPVKACEWDLDFIAFTGHKSLLGPTGTGGFYCKDSSLLKPTIFGGTGSLSDSYDMPMELPDKYQAGTPNVAGIVGLLAALENKPLPLHTRKEFLECLNAISLLPGIQVYKASNTACQGELFSLTHESKSPAELSQALFDIYGIETRSGLHCAPLAHRTLATFPKGTLRFSLSVYHSPEDLAYLLKAITDVTTS